MNRPFNRVAAFCVAVFIAFSRSAAAQSALLPLPAQEQIGDGWFAVSAATPVDAASADETAAADYFITLLRQSGAPSLSPGQGPHAIRFIEESSASGAGPEAYRLQIAPDGISIRAAGAAGLFYGGISLWQLLTTRPAGKRIALKAGTILDSPRFAWRGLMIDSARHFQSPDLIKQIIDRMAIHKLNTLHWHLTDDQGWRIEIRRYPRLTGIGAWRVPAGAAAAADFDPASGQVRKIGGFYSQDDIRDIVAYAALRHVTIVPEIEMPGHATAAIAAYPELGVAPVEITTPSSDWGVHDSLFDPSEFTFGFLQGVLDEVTDLFPGPVIHVGGDEAVKDQWRGSPAVQARLRQLGLADETALQSAFIGRIGDYLRRKGRRLVGWDEILEGDIPADAVVMSWRGSDGARAAAQSGHDTVLSPWPWLYFDNRPSASPKGPPGRGRIVTTRDVYRWSPMPAELTPEQRRHVLGVQANLWTEHVRTERQLIQMAFPRAAALAEIAWSPAVPHDWREFRARLGLQQERSRRLGLAEDEGSATPNSGARRFSQQLRLCSDKLALSLEDDAPPLGPRATFLVDLLDPCWIYPDAPLADPTRLTVSVGQVPFNFRIGTDRDKIHLLPPAGRDGELQIRADRCDGTPILSLPLTAAIGNQALTRLSAPLRGLRGRHDLCFRFTGDKIDPLWVINWIELAPARSTP